MIGMNPGYCSEQRLFIKNVARNDLRSTGALGSQGGYLNLYSEETADWTLLRHQTPDQMFVDKPVAPVIKSSEIHTHFQYPWKNSPSACWSGEGIITARCGQHIYNPG